MGEVWNGLLSGLGAMLSFFYSLIPSYGVAIILLTVAVRLILLPLTIKQTRSMQAMQNLQPKIKELQRKHKGNRQKLNEEMMKLYKEHQVNPLGGCLPLLLQIPVFFALFRVLTDGGGTRYLPEGTLKASIAAGGERFLGMNLVCPPSAAGAGQVAGVDCGGDWIARIPYYALIGLMVFTTYYQSRQMQRASASAGQQPGMQIVTRIMPIFLGFISFRIASGVLVYWVTTNGWQIGQQYLMLRSRPEAGTPARTDGRVPKGGKPVPAEQPKRPGGKNARGRKKRSKR
jgi:YidC/Oxa1 family membrane protein insertase